MKKIRSLFLTVLTCSTLLMPFSAHAEPVDSNTVSTEDITITSGSGVVADLNTGKVLYYKNPDAAVYPASLTKIMTAMIALDNSNPTDILTVSEHAVASMQQKGVMRMSVIAGQQMTMEEALHALLINSANDIAIAIAEHISGSVEAFTELMNQYASNLGCTQTHFLNPTGLDTQGLTTSAMDMAIICQKASEDADFLKICGAKHFTFQSTIMDGKGNPLKGEYTIHNQHKMISGEFPYEYAYSGKTGYTNTGATLATYAKKDSVHLVAVILDCPQENDVVAYEDTKTILDYCFNNYEALSESSTRILNVTGQNSLLADKPMISETHTTVESPESDTLITAVKGHSWQDYMIIVSILAATAVLLVLIIRQSVIFAKRRRRRKNYERMKQQRIEEDQQSMQKEEENNKM